MYYNIFILVLAIPIIAILSDAYIKVQKMRSSKFWGEEGEKKIEGLEKTVQELKSENKGLKERIQNLETIVTHPDWDLLTSHDRGEQENIDKAKELAKKLKE